MCLFDASLSWTGTDTKRLYGLVKKHSPSHVRRHGAHYSNIKMKKLGQSLLRKPLWAFTKFISLGLSS